VIPETDMMFTNWFWKKWWRQTQDLWLILEILLIKDELSQIGKIFF